jgi:hypothetical protein
MERVQGGFFTAAVQDNWGGERARGCERVDGVDLRDGERESR